jgi:hypothetical protein
MPVTLEKLSGCRCNPTRTLHRLNAGDDTREQPTPFVIGPKHRIAQQPGLKYKAPRRYGRHCIVEMIFSILRLPHPEQTSRSFPLEDARLGRRALRSGSTRKQQSCGTGPASTATGAREIGRRRTFRQARSAARRFAAWQRRARSRDHPGHRRRPRSRTGRLTSSNRCCVAAGSRRTWRSRQTSSGRHSALQPSTRCGPRTCPASREAPTVVIIGRHVGARTAPGQRGYPGTWRRRQSARVVCVAHPRPRVERQPVGDGGARRRPPARDRRPDRDARLPRCPLFRPALRGLIEV